MDKVDRVFRASKVAGAWIGPTWARFWPPLGLPTIFGQFPEFFKIRKKLGHFDLEPDFYNFPEIPSSGNLTTQITRGGTTTWVYYSMGQYNRIHWFTFSKESIRTELFFRANEGTNWYFSDCSN